tara:strand:- start:40 stop:225 length:186 start_codon:yes stop_codon:yes gene_type:complete
MIKDFGCHAPPNKIGFVGPHTLNIVARRWFFPLPRVAMGGTPAISLFSETPLTVDEIFFCK